MSHKQEKQISDLPDKILLNIFENLNFETLLDSSLVCKKWNELIGKSSTIMEKIPLVFHWSWFLMNMQPSYSFTRNYNTIKISTQIKWEDILKESSSHVSFWRELEINSVSVSEEDAEYLNKLLMSTKLETLRMIKVNLLLFMSGLDLDLSHLNSLKSLVIVMSRFGVIKFPETAQLKSIKISSLMADSNTSEVFINFLARQKNLEVLAIRNFKFEINHRNFANFMLMQFPLKKLALTPAALQVPDFLDSEEHLLLFMNKFVNTLEELEIGSHFPESLYEMIFKFRKLHTVRVDVTVFEDYSFKNIVPNPSVRKLIVDCSEKYLDIGLSEPIQRFIGNLPNIQDLHLVKRSFSSEDLTFISNNLMLLKSLQVINLPEKFDGVNIPSLKAITVTELKVNKLQWWHQMVTAFPNIEEFTVMNFDNKRTFTAKIVNIITKGWPQLKYAKFGKTLNLREPDSMEIFKSFLHNCKFLKTVEICENAFETISKNETILQNAKQNGYRFIIHSDDEIFQYNECTFGLWKDEGFFDDRDGECDF